MFRLWFKRTWNASSRCAWLPSKSDGTSGGRRGDECRSHTHFGILQGVPERIDAPPAGLRGKDDEKSVRSGVLKLGRCYVTDRGYAKFKLFNQNNSIGSNYICRARDNRTPKHLSPRPLSDANRSAGIESDTEVVFGTNTLNR